MREREGGGINDENQTLGIPTDGMKSHASSATNMSPIFFLLHL